MAYPSRSTPLICLRLSRVGLAADDTAAAQYAAPFACRVHAVVIGCSKLGGTTPHTDVDVTVKKGATDLLSARVAIVDGSAIATGGSAAGSLSTTSGVLDVAAGDVLKLDADITGGSSPLTDLWADVWVSRS